MHFDFIVVMKFADIVAVIIDDIDNDCFLMMMISWLFFISVVMQCSASLLPLPLPPRQSVVSELQLRMAARKIIFKT